MLAGQGALVQPLLAVADGGAELLPPRPSSARRAAGRGGLAIGVGKLDAEFVQDDAEQVRRVTDVPPCLAGENAKGGTIEAPDKRVGRDLGQIIGCESSGRHLPCGHFQRIRLRHEAQRSYDSLPRRLDCELIEVRVVPREIDQLGSSSSRYEDTLFRESEDRQSHYAGWNERYGGDPARGRC